MSTKEFWTETAYMKWLKQYYNSTKCGRKQILMFTRTIITYALQTGTINKKEEDDSRSMKRRIKRIILWSDLTTNGKNTEREQENRRRKHYKLQQSVQIGHVLRRLQTKILRVKSISLTLEKQSKSIKNLVGRERRHLYNENNSRSPDLISI